MKLLQKIIPWIVFTLFAYFLFGNNFNAKLGMVDDHEIKLFLGENNNLSLWEIPATIWSTEVGKWRNTPRYRPTYYGVRVVETFIWGDNPFLWYTSRFAILVVSMYLSWVVLSTLVPSISSYIFIFFVMSGKYWADIFARLGPAEVYSLIFSCIFVFGIVRKKYWLVILGYIITIGTKENLISLFPILITWIVINYSKLKSSKSLIVGILFAILMTVAVSSNAYLYSITHSADIYGNTIGFKDRIIEFFQIIRPEIRKYDLKYPVIFAILAFFQQISFKIIYKIQLMRSTIWLKLLALSLIGVVICSQYIFYNNQIQTGSRYDFPALILISLISLVCISILSDYIILFLPKKYNFLSIVIFALYSIHLLYSINFQNFNYIYTQSARNMMQSQQFDLEINKVFSGVKYHEWPIVMVSDNSVDYESLVALSRYLHASSIKNKLMIKFILDPDLDNVLGNMLQSRIINVMNDGPDIYSEFDLFVQYEKTDPNCYAITFRETAKYTDCEIIGSFK